MDGIKKKQQGTLRVSDEVISKIVQLAVKDTEGVAGFPVQSVDIQKMLMNSKKESAIRIKSIADSVEIDVSVIAKLGYRVTTLGEKIQDRIKNDVQSMTGIMVSRVNVRIAGIEFEGSNKE